VCLHLYHLLVRTSWHRFKEKVFTLFARRMGPHPRLLLLRWQQVQIVVEVAAAVQVAI
jgi:hypothetical protein